MGRTASTWMTYNQAKQLGGQVRRGEKGTGICYTAPVTTKEDETYRVYKWYTVFNADQIDGLPQHFYPQPVQEFVNTDKLIKPAEKLISTTGADIRHGEAKAYYVPAHDYINMPEFKEFRSASYLSHWLKALDNDSKFIFSAASAASQAVTHITAKHAAKEAA